MSILLKNGTVLDYASGTNEIFDLLINDEGKIEKIAKSIENAEAKVIDCSGLHIMPGMIDIHCHLREPGGEHKETIETGSRSAVKGGFTTICPMPNTKPTPDSAIVLKRIIDEAKRVNLCNVLPYSSVTIGEKGEELVDFEAQLAAGACAFSDDGMPIENAAMIREAMIKANKNNSFIAEHCEEKSVAAGAINAGPIAEKLGVKGVLPEAEQIMAARDIVIAETNNLHTHICHISTETTVNTIRSAKQRGVKVTCETCPHYYAFTVDEVLTSGVNAKMNPPLREEKDKGLATAPNGIIGFETALAATITNLVAKGHITYLDMVKLMSYNPAQILGISKGEIREGSVADLTIFDGEKKYIYEEDSIVSKSHNTPWIGKELQGKVMYTIVGGRIVYEECDR